MSGHLSHGSAFQRFARRFILAAVAGITVAPCVAEVSATPGPDGSYHVLSSTSRSRAEVLKSFLQWHFSALTSAADASKATWSADDGVLSEQESAGGNLVRIKLNDLDLSSLRATPSGQWQIWATTVSGHGTGFTGHLNGEGDGSQATALQALQDIYDLAYQAQLVTAAQAHCEFGRLDQYKAQTTHENTNLWSEVRHPVSGKTAEVQILYEVADLVHGPTSGGGQPVSFAAESLSGNPEKIEFTVQLTSNTGATKQYELTDSVTDPSAPPLLGSDSPLAREPFGAGQCITQLNFANIVVTPMPVAPVTGPGHATKVAALASKIPPAVHVVVPSVPADDSQPPVGKKLPTLLPLATTPSLDDACPYPKEARARGETGVVYLLVHVGADGSALDATLEQSSGSESLDRTSAACVKASARFPVRRAGDKPVSYWGRMKFNWTFG